MLPRQTTASSSLSESQLPPPPSPSSLSFVTVRRRRGHQSDDDLDVNDLANTSTTSNNSNHQSILLQTTTTSPHSSSNSLLIDLNSIDQDEHNNSNDLVGGLIGTNDVPLVDDEEEVLVVDGFGGEEGSASNPFNFASADKFEDDFLQQSSMDEMHDEGLEEGEVEDEQEIGEEQQQQLDLLINHHNVHNIERLEDISEEIANVGGVDGGQFSADVDGLEASSMPGGFSFSEYPPQDVVKEANDDSENNNSDDIVDNEQEEDDGLVQLQETHSNLLFQNTTGLPSNLFNPDMLKSPRVFKLSGNRSSVATPNRSITTNMMEWAGATSSVTNTPEGGSYSLASSFMLDESAVAVDSPSSMTPGARKRQLAVRRSGIDSWSKTPTSSRLANTTSSQSPSLTALVEGDHNSSITDDILDNISSTDMPFTSSKMPWDVSLNTVTECSNEEADNNTTEELLLENKSG